MPAFTRQSSRPLSPEHYRRAARRLREFADQIESRADADSSHDKAVRTRAINGLAHYVRDLARRNRGLSAAQEIAMLPNDHHPGPLCRCRKCLHAYTD